MTEAGTPARQRMHSGSERVVVEPGAAGAQDRAQPGRDRATPGEARRGGTGSSPGGGHRGLSRAGRRQPRPQRPLQGARGHEECAGHHRETGDVDGAGHEQAMGARSA